MNKLNIAATRRENKANGIVCGRCSFGRPTSDPRKIKCTEPNIAKRGAGEVTWFRLTCGACSHFREKTHGTSVSMVDGHIHPDFKQLTEELTNVRN